MKYIVLITFIFAFTALVVLIYFNKPQGKNDSKNAVFYAFTKSNNDQSYKKLVHYVFGCEIEMPSNWQFGINGTPPYAVILLFPDGIDTSKFNSEYETVELGEIAMKNLDVAFDSVLNGMKIKHPNLIIHENSKRTINLKEYRYLSFEWTSSKTGIVVYEHIYLGEFNQSVRSICFRNCKKDLIINALPYVRFIESFAVIEKISWP